MAVSNDCMSTQEGLAAAGRQGALGEQPIAPLFPGLLHIHKCAHVSLQVKSDTGCGREQGGVRGWGQAFMGCEHARLQANGCLSPSRHRPAKRRRTHRALRWTFAAAQLATFGDLVPKDGGADCGRKSRAGRRGLETHQHRIQPAGFSAVLCIATLTANQGNRSVAVAPVSPAVSQASRQPSRSTATRASLGRRSEAPVFGWLGRGRAGRGST